MGNDLLQSISQGSYGAQDTENSRIAAIADELERLCKVHGAQSRGGEEYVTARIYIIRPRRFATPPLS